MSAVMDQHRAADFYSERYAEIARYPFVADRPIRIRDHVDESDRRCRFCGRGKPDVTFRNEAHAVPEFLGNKSLLSMNECDECNARFASEYDDHLAKWSHFLRAMSRIPKKRNSDGPTYKAGTTGDVKRVETKSGTINVHLPDDRLKDHLEKQEGPIKSSLPMVGTSQRHVPLRAALALTKIACSICPQEQLKECRVAIDCLRGRLTLETSMFPVVFGFTPGPVLHEAGEAILLQRKAPDRIPYLWCVVRFANAQLQSFVVGCPADEHWYQTEQSNEIDCPFYPSRSPEGTQFGETKYTLLNWSGKEPVASSATATLALIQKPGSESPSDQ